MGKKGRIFDISRGCVDDGPGLRTVVFLKGCPLGCPWCHNPEGKSFKPLIAWDAVRCIGCKKCREACPRDWDFEIPGAWREGCTACGRCAEVCPSGARRVVGKDMDAGEVVKDVLRDEDFFRGTGGGVTFSGGEPFFQPEFLEECLIALKSKGIHTAVETSGFWDRSKLSLAQKFDLVLFDLKHVDSGKFRKATAKDNLPILENLSVLSSSSVPVEIRITIVPDFNEKEEDIRAMARFLKGFKRIPPVRLQPFHRLAKAKADVFGLSYPYSAYEPVSGETLKFAASLFKEEGIEAIF